MVALTLRRANVARKGGKWEDDDFDVFDGERQVGRINRMNSSDEIWFWGVSFLLTNCTSYGHADSIGEAKSAFRREYLAWKGTAKAAPCCVRGRRSPAAATLSPVGVGLGFPSLF